MSISLIEQARLAWMQADFLDKVACAAFQGAVSAVQAAANANATVQAQRITLAHNVINDPKRYVTTFALVCVTRPVVNTADDLTDTFLINTCTNSFDIVAQQLIPAV